MNAQAPLRHRRPRWTRFAKAASRDLSTDIVRTAGKRGIEINFGVAGMSSSTRASSDWSARGKPFDCLAGDGTQEDIYNCLKGHLGHLQLDEAQTGLVLMIAYGLMKAKDLELLPTTWRPQLMAALRMAVLHGLAQEESAASAAARRLEAVVELWRPTWKQDYDCFVARRQVGQLMQLALSASKDLRKSEVYREGEKLIIDGLASPRFVDGLAPRPPVTRKELVDAGLAAMPLQAGDSDEQVVCI